MSHSPYDYATRQSILPISWDDFHALCKGLARTVAPFRPDVILAVARGGLYPGAPLAHLLQTEIYPIRLSRRVHDVVRYETPQWLVRPPDLVRGQRVLVVDEIASTGETLGIVRQEVEQLGAAAVRTAVLYAHTWGAHVPDVIGLISDALILNPWDREVYRDGAFHFHPEYVEALSHQGVPPSADLLITTRVADIAKGGNADE